MFSFPLSRLKFTLYKELMSETELLFSRKVLYNLSEKKFDPWKRHDLGLVWELFAVGYGLLASKICLKWTCKDPIRLIIYIGLGMRINILNC